VLLCPVLRSPAILHLALWLGFGDGDGDGDARGGEGTETAEQQRGEEDAVDDNIERQRVKN